MPRASDWDPILDGQESVCFSNGSHGSHCTSVPSAASAVTSVAPGTLRSAEEAITEAIKRTSRCREDASRMDFPVGPIPGDAKHVEESVRLWARNCSTGGGGHGIRRGGVTSAKDRGGHLRLQCCKDPSRTEICKWECTFEETHEGWVLVRGVWDHNGHDLHAQPAEVMAARGTSFLPQELLDEGRDAADSGQSIKQIDALLRQAAKRRGLPISWEPTHLRSKFNTWTAACDFDLTDFVETLKQREREGNGFELRCNNEGVATHIFVQVDDSMRDWANDDSNVLLFDPTWGTHRAGMKLCCFTSVSAHGQTVVLAFALLVDETADSIVWSFRCFSRHFKKPPTVVFTDDASSISIAFSSMHDGGIWKDTSHLLCTYHLTACSGEGSCTIGS